ncbi:MAG TPA: phosphoadenosine phosphosulfate reductase family protein, partial [Vicinamibacteria bacterium]|nr:phosphoadenosine phosphosulfate reductase family protein [Vicinamibacteria bacterium]
GADVAAYVKAHDVPTNPLHAQGYPSIGCAPCTSPVSQGEDPRAGRWRGLEKKECGLHVPPVEEPQDVPAAGDAEPAEVETLEERVS